MANHRSVIIPKPGILDRSLIEFRVLRCEVREIPGVEIRRIAFQRLTNSVILQSFYNAWVCSCFVILQNFSFLSHQHILLIYGLALQLASFNWELFHQFQEVSVNHDVDLTVGLCQGSLSTKYLKIKSTSYILKYREFSEVGP